MLFECLCTLVAPRWGPRLVLSFNFILQIQESARVFFYCRKDQHQNGVALYAQMESNQSGKPGQAGIAVSGAAR